EANKGFGFVDHHTPEISMAVKSAYRNRDMGTALLKAIAAAYATIGIKQLSLSVDKANPATQLYLRLGYRIVVETNTSWTMKLLLP
ncbi:MAG: GNAT family N-acetyltransferase, partial [Bacteroidota bacterium]